MMVPTFNLGPSKICLGSWGSPAPELWDIPTSSPLFNQFVACIWQTGAVSAGQLEDCALWDAFAFLTYLIWSWTYPQTFNCLINVWDALFFLGSVQTAYPETPHITQCIPITLDSLRMTPSLPGRPVGRAVRNFSHEIGNGVSTSRANKGRACDFWFNLFCLSGAAACGPFPGIMPYVFRSIICFSCNARPMMYLSLMKMTLGWWNC